MTEVADLAQQIDDLHGELRAHVTENTAAHRELREELKRHGKEEEKFRVALFGNGEIGLAERIRVLERFCDAARRLMWILIPAVLLGALALIWQAVQSHLVNGP